MKTRYGKLICMWKEKKIWVFEASCGSHRLGCAPLVACQPVSTGPSSLLHRDMVTWHCCPLVRPPWLIPADGSSVWNGAENVLIFLAFSFCLPFDGGSAACTLAVCSQWTMSHGRCASFTSFPMVFYHSLILLIFSLFEAQGLDVFQLPLK